MAATEKLVGDIEKIFDLLPLDSAMPSLVGSTSASSELIALVSGLDASPEILAGLWLYLGDLDRSHEISQDIHTSTGSYWHAIMHRREGDFWNSKYWYRKVGNHPVISELGYDPYNFVDESEADKGKNSLKLVEMQRREWKALFDWCLKETGNV